MCHKDWKKEYLELRFPLKRQDAKKDEYLELFTKNRPTHLFKFRELNERTLKLLESNEIWAARSDTLNDVDEAKFVIDEEALFHHYKISPASIVPPGIPLNEQPPFIRKFISSIIDDYRKGINICAFSETNCSPAMWAHYAKEHTGICIEYEVEKIECRHEYIYPVIYGPNPIDLTEVLLAYIRLMTTKISTRMPIPASKIPPEWEYNIDYLRWPFFKKYIDWQYENEWRLVKPGNSSDGRKGLIHNMPKPAIVYLGVNYGKNNEDLKDHLREICKNNNCEIIPMTSDYNNFKILPNPY